MCRVAAYSLPLAVAGWLHAQPAELQLVSVTAQQAVIQYRAPNANVCTLAVTDDSGLGVTVWDVSSTTFPNSHRDLDRPNSVLWDNGLMREVVLGKRSAEPGTDGNLYSRSLQANTDHTVTVTCTGNAGPPLRFRTQNIPVGNMAPDPPAFHASGFGNAAWPTVNWSNRNTPYIDPKSGILLKAASWPGDLTFQTSGVLFSKYFDATGAWGNPGQILSGGATALASPTTADPIFVALNPAVPSGSSNWVGYSIHDLRIKFTGNGAGGNRQISFCLTADSGQSCVSAVQTITLPGATGSVLFPATGFPAPAFAQWGIPKLPEHNVVMPVTTTANVAGTSVTNLAAVPVAQGLFPVNLAAGSKVLIAGSSCPQQLCTIAAVASASSLTLQENAGVLSGAALTTANFGLKLWKSSTGPANVTVSYDVAFDAAPGFLIEDGASDQCNRNPITLTRDAAGNTVAPYNANLCLLNYPDGAVLYAFLSSTGEMRPVAMPFTIFGNGIADSTNPRLPPNPWATGDGRTFYGHGFSDNSAPEIVRWVYRGQGKRYTPGALPYQGVYRTVPNGQSDGITSCNGGEQQAGNLCVSLVTNPLNGRDLRTQVTAKSIHMSHGAFGNNPFPVSVVGNMMVSRWSLQQDGVTMFSYVDLANGVVTAVTDTMWSTVNARWGGMHTAAGWVLANRYHLASINPLGSRGNSGPFAGPYRSRVSSVWRSTNGTAGTWDNNTALTANYSYPCPEGICGPGINNAVRLRLAGMPCNATANTNERTHYPCPWDPAQGMLAPLQAGDLLGDFAQPNGGAFSEELRIVNLSKQTDTEIEVWVERGGGTGPAAFSNGWYASPYPSNSCTSANWWLDAMAPGGNMLPDDCRLTGHIDIGTAPGESYSLTSTLNAKFNVPSNTIGIQVPGYSVGGFGTWGQQRETTNFPGNGRVELYPSLRQWKAPDSEKVWAADWRAYQGGAFTASGSGTIQDAISLTQVLAGGRTKVWKASSPYPSQPKLLPMESWAGRYIFRDKSGPASDLTDGDSWSYCVVYKPGECLSGQTTVAGEVYFSAPFIVPSSNCITNHMEAALPCLVPASPLGNWAVQQDISVKDSSSWRFRRLTMAFNAPARQYTATNWRPTPDARWGFMLTRFADGVFPVMFAAKLPPWPGYDLIRRDDFVPRSLQLGPGAALAEIRFGYEEYGERDHFYCTTRQESCVTGTPVSGPFRYLGSDGHSGTSCSTGCSITIPALPGRILWWQEFRSSDGGTSWNALGQIQPLAAP